MGIDLQTNIFGSAPSGSYTDSISLPIHRDKLGCRLSATLAFTPLIAGYWAVSVSCTVTATDTKTRPYWTGSANAGPQDLTSCKLDITYTGSVAGGNPDSGTVVTNKTTDVHVGWPIELGAKLAPVDLATTFTWTIDGAGGNGAKAINGYILGSGNSTAMVAALNPGSDTSATFPDPPFHRHRRFSATTIRSRAVGMRPSPRRA